METKLQETVGLDWDICLESAVFCIGGDNWAVNEKNKNKILRLELFPD